MNLCVNLESKSVTQARENLDLPHHSEKKSTQAPLTRTLTSENLSQLESVALDFFLNKYDKVVLKYQTDIRCITTEQHRTILTNTVPIHRAPYRCSQSDKAEINKPVDTLIRQGVVRASFSLYAACVNLAEKKGEGRTRLCIGYQKLNVITVPNFQPIPSIDDILDHLENAKFSLRWT